MVERPLRMREVPGSIPGFSICYFLYSFFSIIFKQSILNNKPTRVHGKYVNAFAVEQCLGVLVNPFSVS